jgi:hypothetical protein
MGISEKEVLKANRRAAKMREKFPTAVSARYDRRIARVVVTLSSGLELAFSPKLVQGLEHARPTDLADTEVSPSGLGIHFPHLDADVYIPGLLKGIFGTK